MNEIELKQLLHLSHHLLRPVEDLRMHLEDRCGVDRERAVDIYGNGGDRFLANERVNRVDHLLGPAHSKGRNEDTSTARGGAPNHFGKSGLRPFH